MPERPKNKYISKFFIVAALMLASVFAVAQPFTATCKKKCSSVQTTEDCGGGVYKIKWYQGNQWDNAEIWFYDNGTTIGNNSGSWDYEDNVQSVGWSGYPMRVSSNNEGRWIY